MIIVWIVKIGGRCPDINRSAASMKLNIFSQAKRCIYSCIGYRCRIHENCYGIGRTACAIGSGEYIFCGNGRRGIGLKKRSIAESRKIEWTYINSKLADNEQVLETQVLARMTNVKMIIKLSDVGRFIELVNVGEVKSAADKALDELIASTASNPSMNVQYKSVKQMITTKQGLEIALLKQIKFYTFSFGFNYQLNHIQTNNIKFPNPLGGQPFDAVEKVQLTKLDKAKSTCVVETSKIIDGNAVKVAVVNYLKKNTKIDPKEIDAQVGKADMGISENTMQQLDFSKGIVQKSSFKRIMNLGFQNRTTVLEIETVN